MTSFVSPPGRDPGVTASKRMPASRTSCATEISRIRLPAEVPLLCQPGTNSGRPEEEIVPAIWLVFERESETLSRTVFRWNMTIMRT